MPTAIIQKLTDSDIHMLNTKQLEALVDKLSPEQLKFITKPQMFDLPEDIQEKIKSRLK